jgi:pimeloyl-ACP methyl ester carboxylesterase
MRTHEIAGPGGRTLTVLEDGDPDGAPVVKHHGTPGSRLLHPKWVDDAAERGIRLIGYDRAGYGGSDRDAGRDVAAIAADIAAIADALGIEHFATWGGSGGALAEELRTVLSPPDVAVITGELGEFLLASIQVGLDGGVDGWLDDDLAFVKPWGFDPATIEVPVQIWQGEQDLMVPLAHGEWLAGHVPGADRRISPQDGHLTITELHMGEVHAWLLGHF